MKGPNSKQSTRLRATLVSLIAVIICIPVLFTLYKEGRFTPAPTVSVVSNVTDDQADTLTFAADYDFEPYSFYDASGNPSGLDIELATEIANRMGMKVKIVLGNWPACKSMIQSGKADVLLGLEVFADESKTSTLKTIPVSHDAIKIYGKDKILDIGSLYGKKVGIATGSIIGSLFELNCEYVGYNTSTEILQAVADGEVDYGICHASVASAIIRREGLDLVSSVTLMESFPALGIRETAPELEDPLNLTIKAMSDDGTLDRLYDKWIAMNASDQSLQSVLQNNMNFYVGYLLFAAVVLIGAVYLLSLLKNREANLKMAMSYQKVLEAEMHQAEAANRAKSTFLLNMSHDIRTPMNAIIGFDEIAARNIDDREKALDALNKSHRSSMHLLKIINDILDMSRVESGKFEPRIEVIDVKECISEIDDLFRMSMEKKGLNFVVVDGTRSHLVYGDRLRICQAISNLLSNAMKFTDSGGTVTFTNSQSDIDEEGYTQFIVRVKDTGAGMSDDFQKRLFQPFERENTTTISGIEGTGLGLSMARKIAELIGGDLTCTSKLGEGSEFVFTFKAKVADDAEASNMTDGAITSNATDKVDAADATVATSADSPAPSAPSAPSSPAMPASIAGKRVLIVEDNEFNREIARNIVETAGMVSEDAADGAIALDMVSKAAPGYYDLILMDIQMPVMDGYESTAKIRALDDPMKASVPIVALTANAFEEDRRRALDAGMNEHVGKPIDVKRLFDVMGDLLK